MFWGVHNSLSHSRSLSPAERVSRLSWHTWAVTLFSFQYNWNYQIFKRSSPPLFFLFPSFATRIIFDWWHRSLYQCTRTLRCVQHINRNLISHVNCVHFIASLETFHIFHRCNLWWFFFSIVLTTLRAVHSVNCFECEERERGRVCVSEWCEIAYDFLFHLTSKFLTRINVNCEVVRGRERESVAFLFHTRADETILLTLQECVRVWLFAVKMNSINCNTSRQ